MNTVEIIVGHQWKEDVRYIHSLRPRRPAETSLNLLELRDIIDIVIDGSNLTASIPEEAIFGLVGALLSSLVDLVDQTSKKAIIEFHHEPWEMVLVPDGSTLLVSLYSIDRRRRVVARDLGVDVRHFVDALCEVGEQLLTELFGVSDRFSSDPQVRSISQSLAKLRRTPRIQLPPRPGVDGDVAPRMATTSSAGGLSLGYRIDAADSALQAYRGEHVFDLHCLLVDGKLDAEFDGQQLVLCDDNPFLGMCSLLDRTRQLFNQLESHAHAHFVLDEPVAHMDFTVTGEGSRWTLGARCQVDGHWRECALEPAACLDILVSLAELFVQDLLELNAHMGVNHRFIDFKDEVEKLRQWHRDLCGNNLYHDRPEDYLRRLGHIEPTEVQGPEAAECPWPMSSIHTLFPHRRWTLLDEHIDFDSFALDSQTVTLTTSKAVQCLELEDGSERWRYDFLTTGSGTKAIPLSDSLLATTDGGDRLLVMDRQDGSVEAAVDVGDCWRQLMGAAQYEEQNLVVAGRRSGEIVGIDDREEEVRWRHSLGPAELQQIICTGPLVCCQSTEGVIKALNPRTGETLWKIRPAGTPQLPLRLHQGRIYAIAHEPLHRGSTVIALYPYTGRTVWQVRLPGFASGPPSFIDQWMIIPVERHGQLALTAINLEAVAPRATWRLELSSAGIDRPTEVLPVHIDGRWHGLVRTDRAELTCFAADDGQVRWRSVPASETLLLHGNLPLFRVRDAVVNVARTVDLRHLATGKLLHSFSAIEAPKYGFLAPPFRLLLGEQAHDESQADRLTVWSVEHFLALIDS